MPKYGVLDSGTRRKYLLQLTLNWKGLEIMTTKELETLCNQYRELKRMQEELAAEVDAVADQLKTAMGDAETLIVGSCKLSYKTVTSVRLDSTALKKALPDVAARFSKSTTYRRFSVI